MILSINEQAVLFARIFCAGGAAGMLYDFIEILREKIKHKKAAIYIEDIFYWISVILLIFLFLLSENYGEVRFFAVFGFFFGMIIYNFIFSCIVKGILNTVIKVIVTVIKLLVEIIMTPVKLIWLVIGKPVTKAGNVLSGYAKKLLHLGGVYAKISKRNIKNQMRFIKRRSERRGSKNGKEKRKNKAKD